MLCDEHIKQADSWSQMLCLCLDTCLHVCMALSVSTLVVHTQTHTGLYH